MILNPFPVHQLLLPQPSQLPLLPQLGLRAVLLVASRRASGRIAAGSIARLIASSLEQAALRLPTNQVIVCRLLLSYSKCRLPAMKPVLCCCQYLSLPILHQHLFLPLTLCCCRYLSPPILHQQEAHPGLRFMHLIWLLSSLSSGLLSSESERRIGLMLRIALPMPRKSSKQYMCMFGIKYVSILFSFILHLIMSVIGQHRPRGRRVPGWLYLAII